MDLWRTLLKLKPGDRRPDFERFRRALTSTEPGPVPIGDIFADPETVGRLIGEPCRNFVDVAEDPAYIPGLRDLRDYLVSARQNIQFCQNAGWDYVFAFSMIPFRGVTVKLTDNTSQEVEDGKRGWLNDAGPVTSWEEFEKYKWPTDVRVINFLSRLTARRVPDGMKVMVIPGGFFEWTTWLMGLTTFSYKLADDPALVDAVVAKVAGIIHAAIEDLMTEPNVGGIFMGDDMGFSTQTLASPKVMRQKFFPELKKAVDTVHAAGRVFVLHSCGNLAAIMDDLIATGIDGKHSFEDKIMPVTEAHRRWGDRVTLIGGVDMDLLTRGTEDAVRRRTREILDCCGSRGRYVLGTGNSVANYLPLSNYLAMIDEGRKWNREQFGREA